MKNTMRFGALAAASAIALAACSSAPEETEASASETAAATTDFKACMVSDSGGFDDGSFNQTGYEGLVAAEGDFGIEIATVESADESEYTGNVQTMVDASCSMIITVGFALADATAESATANPDIQYAIIDNSYEEPADNVKGLTYETDQAAFLAGYAAANASKSGVVATYGGAEYPTVTIFMEGFRNGVLYYNEVNGTDVQVLGWDGTTGSFTGDFEDVTKGQSVTQGFVDQGADVIMPVAGPVGDGSLAVASENEGVWVIGVDADWTLTKTDYTDVILTSVLKNNATAVYTAIQEGIDGTFSNELYVGTLENGGTGIADIAEGAIDDETAAALEEIEAGIIDGSISVSGE